MNNFIKILFFVAICSCAAICLLAKDTQPRAAKKLILINQFVEHPALNSTVKGIIDALADNGFIDGETATIRVESAQANSALASQISSKFVNQSPDVVVCVGTVSAQSMAKYAMSGMTKMIFSSVTDPITAGLIKELSATNFNITGVSNFVELDSQIELIKEMQPNLKTIGMLYNAGELNSVTIVNKLCEVSKKFGIKIIKQAVTKTSDVSQAAVKLSSEVDAIFISNDNTALSCLTNIIRAANAAKIPVYVSDTDAVELGALAAFGPNQYNVGRQTGDMVARILNGEDISNIPVEFPDDMELFVNKNAAKLLNINIPEKILLDADKIINF